MKDIYLDQSWDVTEPRMIRLSTTISGCNSPDSFTSQTLGSPRVYSKCAWKRGYVNRNWRAQQALGLDVSSPYELRTVTYIPGYQQVLTVARNGCAVYSSTCSGVFAFDAFQGAMLADDDPTDQRALKKLKSRLSDSVGMMQAMPPIAEARELGKTFKFLSSSALDILKVLVDIKRTRGKSAFKYASEAWLNWSFAIKPTLSDIEQLGRSIDAFIRQNTLVNVRKTGSAEREWTTRYALQQQTSFTGQSNIVARCEHSIRYSYVAGVNATLRSAEDYGLCSQFGVSVPMLVPTMWELTAFSWLFDYFTNVGDFLEDTFQAENFKTVYCTRTRKYECVTTWEVPPAVGPYILGSSVTGPSTTARVLTVTRTPLSIIPPTRLYLKTEDQLAKNGVNKVLNLLAVLMSGRVPYQT